MLLLLSYATLTLLVDQGSKFVVQRHLTEGVSWGSSVRISPSRKTRHIYKTTTGRTAFVLVWCIALVSAVWLHSSGVWLQGRSAVLGMGLAIGGAAGNLADMLRQQCVVDFIDLGWWPIFNLADVAIVGGLVLAFWLF